MPANYYGIVRQAPIAGDSYDLVSWPIDLLAFTGGLAFTPNPTLIDVLISSPVELAAVTGSLGFSLQSPDVDILTSGIVELGVFTGTLSFTPSSPTVDVLSSTPIELGASTGGLSYSPQEPTVDVLTSTEVVLAADVGTLGFTLNTVLTDTLTSSPTEMGASVGGLLFAPSSPTADVLSNNPAEIAATVGALSFSVQDITVDVLVSTPVELESFVKYKGFTVNPGDIDVLTQTPIEIGASVGSLGFTVNSVGDDTLSSTPINLGAASGSLSFSIGSVGEDILASTPVGMNAFTGSLGFSLQGIGLDVLLSTPIQMQAWTGGLSFSTGSVGEDTLSSTVINLRATSGSLNFSLQSATTDVIASSVVQLNASPGSLSFFPQSAIGGVAGDFNGTSSYLYRSGIPGYLTNSDFGQVGMWIKSSGMTEQDAILFSVNAGNTPRLQMGITQRDIPGEPNLFIEVDDGTFTNDWTVDVFNDLAIDLFDNQWHFVVFGNTPPDGYGVWVDGQYATNSDPQNVGQWYKYLQQQAGNFSTIGIGAFVTNPGGANDEYWQGGMDEVFITDENDLLTLDEIVSLYNGGKGSTIPEIEGDPNLWSRIYNAYELESLGAKEIGDEYRFGSNDLTPVDMGNLPDGIQGGWAGLARAAEFYSNINHSLIVNDNASLNHSGSLTITAWVKFRFSGISLEEAVVVKASPTTEYALIRDGSERLIFRCRCGGVVYESATPASYADDATPWYFMAGRVSSVGVQLIYGKSTDGSVTSATNVSTSGNALDRTSSDLQFGRSGSGSEFDGLIDEVMLYHTRLGTAEIATLFNAGAGKSFSVLVQENPAIAGLVESRWSMDEASGTRFDTVGSNDALVDDGDPFSDIGHVVG